MGVVRDYNEIARAFTESVVKIADLSNTTLRAQVLWYFKTFVPRVSPDVRREMLELLESKTGLTKNMLETLLEIESFERLYVELGGKPALHIDSLPQGFLSDYVRYNSTNEGPDLFHFWCGAVVVACALNRKVWVDKQFYKVYPNLQVILVAPAGRCRKTFSSSIAVELVRELDLLPVIAEKITPEALAYALKVESSEQNSMGLIYAPELAVFLGKQKYNEGLIALLTTLADCPSSFVSQTRGGGRIYLRNVFIAMLGASTPDWLATAIPETAFGGGFMSRIVFVCLEDSPKVFPFPQPPPFSKDYLKNTLLKIQKLEGEFVLTDRARGLYEAWYLVARHEQKLDDWRLAGYYERKPDHLLRLATVLAASQLSTEIDVDVLDSALRVLSVTETTMPQAFSQLEMSQVGKDHLRVVRALTRAGGRMSHSALLRLNLPYMNGAQFRLLMSSLVEAGVVEEVRNPLTREHFYVLKST